MVYEPVLATIGVVFALLLIFVFWLVIKYERAEAKRKEEAMIRNMMEAMRRFEEWKKKS